MALNRTRGGIKACWATEYPENSTAEIGNYGERFKMPRQEFEDIRTHLKLSDYTADDVRNVILILLKYRYTTISININLHLGSLVSDSALR